MRITKEIPNFLKIRTYTATIDYIGVTRLCKRCRKSGHYIAKCPFNDKRKKESPNTFAAVIRNAMEEEEAKKNWQKKRNKRKK